jgi:hypothetical protein
MTYAKPQLLLIGDIYEVIRGLKGGPQHEPPPNQRRPSIVAAYEIDE